MTKRPEVWMINNCSPNNLGGVETCSRKWARTFEEHDRQVVWFCPNFAGNRFDQIQTETGSLQTVYLESSPIPRLANYPSKNSLIGFKRRLEESKPEAIIVNSIGKFLLPFFAISTLSSRETNKLLVVHGNAKLDAHKRKINLKKKCFQNPEWKVVAVSEHVRQDLMKSEINKEIVVCNPTTENSFQHRRRNNVGDRLTALTVSRISPEKGIKFLFEMASESKTEGLPYNFRLVGGASNKEYEERINSKTAESGVENVGIKTGDELYFEYTRGDLFILPSPDEGFGLVTIEALQCGLPVLGNNIPGTREIFSRFREKPGELINNMQEGIEFMRAYSELPDLRNRLNMATKQATELFNPDKMSEEFVNLVLENKNLSLISINQTFRFSNKFAF